MWHCGYNAELLNWNVWNFNNSVAHWATCSNCSSMNEGHVYFIVCDAEMITTN
eukprot:m.54206 g.54206  ORF g.54206 m.54206 type:complete len:53 (+) comp7708_c0_seq6:78-236(+)